MRGCLTNLDHKATEWVPVFKLNYPALECEEGMFVNQWLRRCVHCGTVETRWAYGPNPFPPTPDPTPE